MPVNPQTDNGYTRIANEIMEALAKHRVPGAARQCMDVVLRMTYGYSRKTAPISITHFQKMTGLDRRNVSRAISKLSDMRLIAIVKNDDTKTVKYGLNKNYEQWRLSSKMTHPPKRPKAIVKNDDDLSSKMTHPTYIKENYKESITPRLQFEKKVPLPKDFQTTEDMKKYATSKNYIADLNDLTEGFTIYHRQKGSKFKDWHAAWQNWLRNDIKFHPENACKIGKAVA